jgi:hypothetical protein
MTIESLREMVSEYNDDAMLAEGLDDAIIGMACRCGSDPVVAYDTTKVIAIFVKQGMTEEEAIELISGINYTGENVLVSFPRIAI